MQVVRPLASWLERETQCAPEEPEPPLAVGAPGSYRRGLGRFIRVQPPGAIDVDSQPLDGDRAPLVITTERHRRIPIDWAAVLDSEQIPVLRTQNPRKRSIEKTWLSSDDIAEYVPDFAILDPGDVGNWCRRDLIAITTDSPIRETPVPQGGLVVTIGEDATQRAFHLIAREGAGAADGKRRWSDFAEAWEVFRKTGAAPSLDAIIAQAARGDVQSAFSSLSRTAGLLAQISAQFGMRTLRNLVIEQSRPQLLEKAVADHLWQANVDGTTENYWTVDEAKKQAAMAKTRGLLIAPVQGAGVEQAILAPVTDKSWIIAAGERRWLIHFAPDTKVTELRTFANYEQAWAATITYLEPLAWAPSRTAIEAEHFPFSYIEKIDLQPQTIVEEFARLNTELEVATATGELANSILTSVKDKIDDDMDSIRDRIGKARELKAAQYDAESKIRVLQDRARKIGFYLATGFKDPTTGLAGNEIMVPSGPVTQVKKTVDIGQLYRVTEEVATYQVKASEVRSEWGIGIYNPFDSLPLPGGFLGIGRHQRRHDYTVTVHVSYTDLKKVALATEPWADKRDALQVAGFTCQFAELTDDGYVLRDGTPVRELIERCSLDETYRQSLALFLPVYQDRLTEGLIKVRYLVVIRPEPGIEPVNFPSVFCEEHLSYRADWRGTELGELLHSVALAPGEERKVHISRSIERMTEKVDSITTVLDVTQSQRLDLTTSLQTTISNEKNSKSSSEWNAKASASYGPFSAGGGGGGSSETSIRDFSETIRKSAQQSTAEMRKNTRQEIKSTTTTTTKVTSLEDTQSAFANINQGSTLNIMFHELNAVYGAALFLDELKLAYRPSVELVAGTALQDVITFDLGDLERLVSYTASDPLFVSGLYLFDQTLLERAILRTVMRTIFADYVDMSLPDQDDLEVKALGQWNEDRRPGPRPLTLAIDQTGAALISSLAKLVPGRALPLASIAPKDDGDLREEIRAYSQILLRLAKHRTPILPHVLIVPSPAIYADSVVGAMPATEPYSDAMRAATLDGKRADAAARWTDSLPRPSGWRFWHRVPAALVASVQIDADGMQLRIRAARSFDPGRWQIFRNDEVVAECALATSAREILVITKRPIAEQDAPSHWSLRNVSTGSEADLPLCFSNGG
jgi:hypothetical protein